MNKALAVIAMILFGCARRQSAPPPPPPEPQRQEAHAAGPRVVFPDGFVVNVDGCE